MTPAAPHKKRLGEILVQRGMATPDQIKIALLEQKRSREHLGKILVRLGFATESIIRDVVGGVIGQESVDLARAVADSEAVSMIPKALARHLKAIPVNHDAARGLLTVAMADTFDVVALDQLKACLDGAAEIVPVLAGEAEIEKCIDRFYGFELSVDGILNEIETGEIDYQSLDAESNEYSQPVVRLVNALLSDAVKRGASDIHFEPEAGFLRFRYRIDGVLRQVRSLHRSYWSAIAVRLKVMAGLDIAETRAPQDGRIGLSLSGRQVDFRVSSLPTVHGENIVLRVLDRQKGIVSIERLGLTETELEALKRMAARPEGIIIVTGPTGSGKTTTLYSILSHLNTEAVNIMTLGRPGGVSHLHDSADLCERDAAAQFRQWHTLHAAPGSGHHLSGRNPRRGHRRHGLAGRHDRPSGLRHLAHQFRHRRHSPVVGHRREARHVGGQHRGRGGPKISEEAVQRVQDAAGGEWRDAPHLRPQGVPGLRQPRLSGTHVHHGDP